MKYETVIKRTYEVTLNDEDLERHFGAPSHQVGDRPDEVTVALDTLNLFCMDMMQGGTFEGTITLDLLDMWGVGREEIRHGLRQSYFIDERLDNTLDHLSVRWSGTVEEELL